MQNRYHPLVEPSPNCSFSIPTAICLCNVYRYSSSLQKFISTFFLPIQERSFLTPHFSLLISLLKRNNFPIFPLEAIQQKLTKTALFYCYIQNNFLLIYNTETQKISTLSYLYILYKTEMYNLQAVRTSKHVSLILKFTFHFSLFQQLIK